MTIKNPQQVVLLAFFITVASTIGGNARGTTPKGFNVGRSLSSSFFAFLGTSILALADTEVGALLATAIAGTAFFQYGLPALESNYGKRYPTIQQQLSPYFTPIGPLPPKGNK